MQQQIDENFYNYFSKHGRGLCSPGEMLKALNANF